MTQTATTTAPPSGVTATTATSHDKAIGEESLAPQQTRIMDPWSYLFAWLGGCVSIGTFTVGSGLVGTLNLLQTFVAIAIGCTVIGLALMINGRAGHIYGIPFMVQARSSFGFAGTRLPALVRSVPAIVWYGFQSWIGAGALNLVAETLFGYSNIWLFFIGFQFLQIGLSVLGFHGIKWLENIGSVFIIGALVYMFISVINKYGAEISANLINVEGTWGAPFWGATMLFLGVYSTMMLNVSDYSRELQKRVGPLRQVAIYANSILPATLFMGLIGLMVSGATGEVDPIKVFSSAVDNKFLLIITLLFIVFAQVTTNILNNVVPPAYALMDIFKLKFKTSAVLVGLLAFATFPWMLVRDESAAGLNLFIQTYSAFLGPIFAILVVDFYAIRRQKLDLDKLYDETGPYAGINPAAVIATVIGVISALTFSGISWYASLIPAGLSYYLLMQYLPAARRFAS
ncbi:NCS1 family transporter [uncultured Paracoccus sp.]|uniref:NCS1 family transporter n=1 Tax=uncultured Paracoccus sp. TaxID=189685 RepID=UPI0026161BCE|nr:NCS1 family transporter [uncultured Paracoccus sp.]